jgi:hypothetical protein
MVLARTPLKLLLLMMFYGYLRATGPTSSDVACEGMTRHTHECRDAMMVSQMSKNEGMEVILLSGDILTLP